MRIVSLICLLLLSMAGVSSAAEAGMATVTGSLANVKGKPLTSGMVFFFNAALGPPPAPDKYWRVPEEVGRIEENGSFSVELPAGTYYIGGVHRKVVTAVGPPQDGDLFFVHRDEKQNAISREFKAGTATDLGRLAGAVPYVKKTSLEEGSTAIEGQILNSLNLPVEGMIVYAWTKKAMTGKPVFVTERTGKDGKYLMRVHKGGDYYLMVRDEYGGGVPRVGAFVGVYGGEEPKPVRVKTGAVVRKIDIQGEPFAGTGEEAAE